MATPLQAYYFQQDIADDDLLFHYTTLPVAIEHILFEKQLRFSSLSGSKDPLEFEDFSISSASIASGDQEVVKQDLQRKIEKGERLNDLIKRRFKVACFCADAEVATKFHHGKGCYRSRMWTQYADGHSGVCIVFSKSALLLAVRAHIGASDLLLKSRVRYSNDGTSLADILFLRPGNDWQDETKKLLENSGRLLFTKLEDYRDESEYRICYVRQADMSVRLYELVDCQEAIVGAIIGSRFPTAYIEMALSLTKQIGVPMHRCYWLHGRPFTELINLPRDVKPPKS
jgi:hypothetical protein